MENLDLFVLSGIVVVCFVVFVVESVKEFTKSSKTATANYDGIKPIFGRDILYSMIAKLAEDDSNSVDEKKTVLKVLDRTISDMETNGMYFPDEVKAILKKDR
jgi:hypothetical protein